MRLANRFCKEPMQVRTTDQSLGGLLGQLGPRRAGATQSGRQASDFEAYVGREASRRTTSAGSGRSVISGGQPASSSNSGTSVPTSGTSSTARDAGTAPARAAAETAQPVTEATTTALSEAPSPFAPSGLNEPSPAAPWPVTIVTPSTLPDLAHESKAALADAMVKAGLDPSQYRVSYWEELVWYPAGNFINKFLTVQGPDGQKTDFDASWTLKTPWVTATTLKDQVVV